MVEVLTPGHRRCLERPLTAVLSTVGPSGRPSMSLVWYGLDEEGVWLSVRPTSAKARHAAARPDVSLLVASTSGGYLRIDGRARPDGELEAASPRRRELVARYVGDDAVDDWLAGHPLPGPNLALRIEPRAVVDVGFEGPGPDERDSGEAGTGERRGGRPAGAVGADALTVIAARRTSLRVDADRPVPRAVVEELCRAATWAPNHHRTWPWRFAAFTGQGRARLGEALAEHEHARGSAPEKVAKARAKYLRAPLVLAVGCASASDADALRRAEDRDAAAAATQNLLLAATALGLASYWGTGSVTEAPAVAELCGLGPDDALVAVVYLGWPKGDPPQAPPRPAPDVRWVD
jgi:PPOX class probable F420-dependent enzyme